MMMMYSILCQLVSFSYVTSSQAAETSRMMGQKLQFGLMNGNCAYKSWINLTKELTKISGHDKMH